MNKKKMKFNLKENLKRFNLLNEGWKEDLNQKYSEDILNYVQFILDKNYSSEDTSKNPLAPWIAKTVQEKGGIESMGNSDLHGFEVILNYLKSQNNSKEAADKIIRKSPADAYKIAKEELQNQAPSDIKKWEDLGYIKKVGNAKDGAVWVQILDKRWFDCSNDLNKNFGIECQRNNQTASQYATGNYATYTLLGKPKNVSGDYYSTLASIAINKGYKSFIEIKQVGNQQPGAQDVEGWSKSVVAEMIVDFITKNTEVKDINKFVDFFQQNQIPNHAVNYGGAGAFAYLLKNYPNLIQRIIDAKPEVLETHEALIRNVKPDFLENLEVNYEQLLRENPKKFIEKFKTYYDTKGQEIVDLLSLIDFNTYVNQNGTHELFKSLTSIIEAVPFAYFKNNIYPYIDFSDFINTLSKDDIKNLLRIIRNKFDKNINGFLEEFNLLFKNDMNSILASLGGTEAKGIAVLQNLFKSPRLSKHQNYRIVKGKVLATTEEPKRDSSGNLVLDSNGNRVMELVEKEVPADDMMLSPKGIRTFYMKNEELIKSQLPGNKEDKEIGFLKYLIINSSEQEREKLLKNEKDNLIDYYDKKNAENKSELPGIFEYSKIVNQTITEPSESKAFSEGTRIYKFDKKDFKDVNNIKKIFKYYSEKNTLQGTAKLVSVISAIIDTAKLSGISNEEIKVLAFNNFTPDKILKANVKLNDFILYCNMLLGMSDVYPDTIIKNDILNLLKTDTVNNLIIKSKNSASTEDAIASENLKTLINNLNKDNNLEEQKTIRRYIQNLLENNFRKYDNK
jgi:hypothetical protein